MKLLVTGGAGFIGSNFIHYWLHKYPKDKIVNLDKLTYASNIQSLRDVSKKANYTFIKGDICSKNVVKKAVQEVDCIVHFAAESHVDRSITGPVRFVKTNVFGTLVLLEAALNEKVKRFHYVSTDEVFGALPLSSKKQFTETTPYNPRNPYSASKAASDHFVRSFFHTYKLPVTITNCSNNFGPFAHPEKFIPAIITNILLNKPIRVYGDGLYVRDWLYVKDHCRAIDMVLKKGIVGETYCVGGKSGDINNLALVKTILDLMGGSHKLIKFVKDRPGHDRKYSVNWNKIRKQLGWQPEHDFKKHLQNTIEWYKENEWWWGPLKKKAEKLYAETGQK